MVPAESGILSAREMVITDMDAALLVQKLASREYSAYEVIILLDVTYLGTFFVVNIMHCR